MKREQIQHTLNVIYDQVFNQGRADLYPDLVAGPYIQHNPLVVSGRDAVVKFFGSRPKKPIPEKMQTKVVAVIADGDLVLVAFPRELKDPKDPSKTYTTTWFDMWRIQNGKAAEHWDGAMKP